MYQFIINDLGKIAYQSYSRGGKCIFFCGGYQSDMMGYKVTEIEKFCSVNNFSFVKFDYIGHGESSGIFLKCNMSIWLESAISVLKIVKEEKIILIGSSMGGWIAMLLAIIFPKRISSIICIAAAPDFTEDMYNDMTEIEKQSLNDIGFVELIRPSSMYLLTKDFIFDAKKHLLLNKHFIPIKSPVSLLHSMHDTIVDYKKSIEIMQKIQSPDVDLMLIKNSDHSMNNCIKDIYAKIICHINM